MALRNALGVDSRQSIATGGSRWVERNKPHQFPQDQSPKSLPNTCFRFVRRLG